MYSSSGRAHIGSSTIVDRVPIGIVDRSGISRTTVNRAPDHRRSTGAARRGTAREESTEQIKSNRKIIANSFSRGRFQVIIDHCRQSFRGNVGLRRPAEHENAHGRGKEIVIYDCVILGTHATGNRTRNNFEHNESRVVFREHAGRRG